MKSVRLAGLLSGPRSGSTLQSVMDACKQGDIPAEMAAVIGVNAAGAYAMERAEISGVERIFIDACSFADEGAYHAHLRRLLEERGVGLIVLCGYMRRLSPDFVHAYMNRIMNIHPALIPSFCGKGMYGMAVHQAVLDYGCKLSGCTVHFADEEYDHGPIILQIPVPVLDGDTSETLSARVHEQEMIAYPRAIRWFAEGRLSVEGRRVRVRE
ncbi:MAG: phosphoribosylglycinamide formyltransferase [Armatimonadetes bacterium]|nr:phosphoribosylglycinamide formyltransferase [Armatimonadota bacterium]